MTADTVESLVRTVIKTGTDPQQILIGIHNAFVHGEILEYTDYIVDDLNLGRLFDGFEISISALKQMRDK